jgi:hypothetical protein
MTTQAPSDDNEGWRPGGVADPCWLLPCPAQDRAGFAESPACFGGATRALTKRVEELAEPRDYGDQARVALRQRYTSRCLPTRRSGLWHGHRSAPATPIFACRKRAPSSAAAGPPATDQALEPHRVRPHRHRGRERNHRHLARIGAPREARDDPALASAGISKALAMADQARPAAGPHLNRHRRAHPTHSPRKSPMGRRANPR